MRTLPWSRDDLVTEVRDRIWLHLTPTAERHEATLLEASALLQLSEAEALTLGRIHFLVSDEVGDMLESLPRLLRRLPSTSVGAEVVSEDRVVGPINWPKTHAARGIAGSASTYVTNPAARAYELPPNVLLANTLDAIIDATREVGWAATKRDQAIASIVERRGSIALKYRHHRPVSSIPRGYPDSKILSRVQGSRHRTRFAPVSTAAYLYRELVAAPERARLRDVVERTALLTASDAVLFEVKCLFDVIERLADSAWKLQRLRLFGGHLRLEGRRREQKLTLWYQHAPSALSTGSRYAAILGAHNVGDRAAHLRPDFVISLRDGEAQRWIIGEVKMGVARSADGSGRAAVHDLLAYRRAYARALSAQPEPYGLGVVWGSDQQPSIGSEVLICTPDTLAEGLAMLIGMNRGTPDG